MMTKLGERGIRAHAPSPGWMHSSSSEEGGPVRETHDGGFELVVGVMREREEWCTGARDCVEEKVVAGVACNAFYGAGGGDGGKRKDTPGDVRDVVGDSEVAGVVGGGVGHVGGGGLEVVHDMYGQQSVRGEQLAEEE